MRDIKFRAWDKQDGRWVKEARISFFNEGFTVNGYSGGSFELVQFTGLLDVAGKEIYEGDVLKVVALKMKVVWSERKAQWRLEEIDGGTFEETLNINKAFKYKVIGNIYENPELIKN